MNEKRILLFSTLNPYPFWAGSENLWFDAVRDERFAKCFRFSVLLADSPVTRRRALTLKHSGTECRFYKHYNVSFARRNIRRAFDRVTGARARTLSWYREIERDSYDLVLFNVAALADLSDLAFAVSLCKKSQTPYWLLLQHGYEDFFFTSREELETVAEISSSAARFVFVSRRNRVSLERALGSQLDNAFHTVNAIPDEMIASGKLIAERCPPRSSGTARLFNLGRFSPQDKAQHLILESLAAEQWASRDWRMSFIGVSGFGKEYLERMAQFYSLPKHRIVIQPHTDDVFAAIAENDVLVMPSLAEGTPYSMIEAMVCGRPAVGTPVGGIPELIIDEGNGWLAGSTDIQDVSETLERMWSDRQEWKPMGTRANQLIDSNFNQKHRFDDLLEALKADAGI